MGAMVQPGDAVWVEYLDDEPTPAVLVAYHTDKHNLASIRLEDSGREYKVSTSSIRRRSPTPNASTTSLTALDGQPSLVLTTLTSHTNDEAFDVADTLAHPGLPEVVLAAETHLATGGTIMRAGSMTLVLPASAQKQSFAAAGTSQEGPRRLPRYGSVARAVLAAGAFAQQDQVVVAHGRPGSGKSMALQHTLLQVAQEAGSTPEELARMQQALLLLNALTTASTTANPPSPASTRAALRLRLHLDSAGRPRGFTARVDLLEASRLTRLGPGQRTFNILHHLDAGAPQDMRRSLLLFNPSYPLLSRAPKVPDAPPDGPTFTALCAALEALAIPSDLQRNFWRCLAAVILLSSVSFSEQRGRGATPASASTTALASAATLLGVEQLDLMGLLSDASVALAKKRRDAVVSELYTEVVRWAVDQVNAALGPQVQAASKRGGWEIVDNAGGLRAGSIGRLSEGRGWRVELVDVGGVQEQQEFAGLDQLLLAYVVDAAAEAAVADCFGTPRNNGRAEELRMPDVRREDTTRQLVEFLEARDTGVLPLLVDFSSGSMYGGSTGTLRELIRRNPARRAVAEFPTYPEDAMTVHHTTARVEYSLAACLQENQNAVPKDLLRVLGGSTNPIVAAAAAHIDAQMEIDKRAIEISPFRGEPPRIRPPRAQAALTLLDEIRAAAGASALAPDSLVAPATHHLLCVPSPTAADQACLKLLKAFSIEQAALMSACCLAVRLPTELCADRWDKLKQWRGIPEEPPTTSTVGSPAGAAGSPPAAHPSPFASVAGRAFSFSANADAVEATRSLLAHAGIPKHCYHLRGPQVYLSASAAAALHALWRAAAPAGVPSLASYDRSVVALARRCSSRVPSTTAPSIPEGLSLWGTPGVTPGKATSGALQLPSPFASPAASGATGALSGRLVAEDGAGSSGDAAVASAAAAAGAAGGGVAAAGGDGGAAAAASGEPRGAAAEPAAAAPATATAAAAARAPAPAEDAAAPAPAPAQAPAAAAAAADGATGQPGGAPAAVPAAGACQAVAAAGSTSAAAPVAVAVAEGAVAGAAAAAAAAAGSSTAAAGAAAGAAGSGDVGAAAAAAGAVGIAAAVGHGGKQEEPDAQAAAATTAAGGAWAAWAVAAKGTRDETTDAAVPAVTGIVTGALVVEADILPRGLSFFLADGIDDADAATEDPPAEVAGAAGAAAGGAAAAAAAVEDPAAAHHSLVEYYARDGLPSSGSSASTSSASTPLFPAVSHRPTRSDPAPDFGLPNSPHGPHGAPSPPSPPALSTSSSSAPSDSDSDSDTDAPPPRRAAYFRCQSNPNPPEGPPPPLPSINEESEISISTTMFNPFTDSSSSDEEGSLDAPTTPSLQRPTIATSATASAATTALPSQQPVLSTAATTTDPTADPTSRSLPVPAHAPSSSAMPAPPTTAHAHLPAPPTIRALPTPPLVYTALPSETAPATTTSPPAIAPPSISTAPPIAPAIEAPFSEPPPPIASESPTAAATASTSPPLVPSPYLNQDLQTRPSLLAAFAAHPQPLPPTAPLPFPQSSRQSYPPPGAPSTFFSVTPLRDSLPNLPMPTTSTAPAAFHFATTSAAAAFLPANPRTFPPPPPRIWASSEALNYGHASEEIQPCSPLPSSTLAGGPLSPWPSRLHAPLPSNPTPDFSQPARPHDLLGPPPATPVAFSSEQTYPVTQPPPSLHAYHPHSAPEQQQQQQQPSPRSTPLRSPRIHTAPHVSAAPTARPSSATSAYHQPTAPANGTHPHPHPHALPPVAPAAEGASAATTTPTTPPAPPAPAPRPPSMSHIFADRIDNLQVEIAEAHHRLEIEIRAISEIAEGKRGAASGATPSRMLSEFLDDYKQRMVDVKEKLKGCRKDLGTAKRELGTTYANLGADLARVEGAHKQWKYAFKARLGQAQKHVSDFERCARPSNRYLNTLATSLLPHHRRRSSS